MKFILLLFILSITLQSIFSETLVLKDGTIIKMTLKTQDVSTLTYTLKGKEYKVPKNKVRRVVYAKTPELEEKIAKEELHKIKQEKAAKKPVKTKEEEEEEVKQLEEEVTKAMEEQKKQELLNLSFGERIHKLENEFSDLKSSGGESPKIAKIEEDIKDLKTRTRRIERFLEIDPDIEDYYSKPRSMWSIVWRSALIPGWGLSYGRDSGFGTMYSSVFFISAIGGAAYKQGLKSLDKTLDDKLINDLIVQPYALSILSTSFTSGTTSSTLTSTIESYKTYNSTVKLVKYNQSRESFNNQLENSDKILAFAAGLYAVQLIHSAIYGYFWAKRTPGKFSEEKTSGWKIQLSPLARRNPITNNQDWQMDLGYRFEF